MAQERRSRFSAAQSSTQSASSRAVPFDPAWLTVSQLCRRWQLGRKTVYKFIDAEILPAWKVGGHLYRVAVADVLRFEARNKRPPEKSVPSAVRVSRSVSLTPT